MDGKGATRYDLLALGGFLCLAVALALIPFITPSLWSMDRFFHEIRLLEVHRCLGEGHLWPDWSPDLAHGHGQPLFHYYPVGLYLLASPLLGLGMDPKQALLVVVTLAFALSAYAVYRTVWSRVGAWAGVVAGVLWMTAPHFAVNLQVRSGLTWMLGLSLLPVALGGVLDLAQGRPSRSAWLRAVGGLAALCLVHNLVALLAAGACVVLALAVGISSRERGGFVGPLTALALALAMTAFFWLPAALDMSLVHLERMNTGFFDPAKHGVYPSQLVGIAFGRGPSVPGPDDGMSLSMGAFHALGLLVVLMFAVVRAKRVGRTGWTLLGSAVVLVLVMLPVSGGVFHVVPLIGFLQFPWRLLGPLALVVAWVVPLAGFAVLPSRAARVGSVLLVAAVLASTGPSFMDLRIMTVEEYAAFDSVREKGVDGIAESPDPYSTTTGVLEYLPRTAPGYPEVPSAALVEAPPWVEVTKAEKDCSGVQVEVRTDQAGALRINVFDFPFFAVDLDGLPAPHRTDPETGFVLVGMTEPGAHTVSLRLTSTPIQAPATALSLVGLLAAAVLAWRRRKGWDPSS